jgi:hypothetical protein
VTSNDKTPQLLSHLVSNVKNLTPNVMTVGIEKYGLSLFPRPLSY